MTSLSPGVLFHTTGLNRMSTPVGPDSTNVEIEKLHKKVEKRRKKQTGLTTEPYNGNPWPRDSPVAMVYDVGNSSTSMILLNNRNKTNSRLRGQGPMSRGSVNEFGDAETNPDRHFEKRHARKEFHNPCLDSSSPYFEPDVQSKIDWINRQQRPPWRPDGESAVNNDRHTSCRNTTDPIYYSLEHKRPRTTPGSRRTFRGPRSVENNYYLHHPQLSMGQRLYLWSTAHVYSQTDMKCLKTKQYLDLLTRERRRGFHSDREYYQYDRFIRTPRRLTSEDYYRDRERAESRRARTAHGRLQKDEDGLEEPEEEPVNDGQKGKRGSSARSVTFDNKNTEKERRKSKKETDKEDSKTAENKENTGDATRKEQKSQNSERSSKRDTKSASSKRSSEKTSRSSSRTSSRDKAPSESQEGPDTSDKKGRGPIHVNVDVASSGPSQPSLAQEPGDREPNDADKLEY